MNNSGAAFQHNRNEFREQLLKDLMSDGWSPAEEMTDDVRVRAAQYIERLDVTVRGFHGVYWVPEFARCAGVEQPRKHHAHNVLRHLLWAAFLVPKKLDLKVAALFHDIGKPATLTEREDDIQFHGHAEVGAVMLKHIARRLDLKGAGVDTARVESMVLHHMFEWPEQNPHTKAVGRLIERIGLCNLVDQFRLRLADRRAGLDGNPGPWIKRLASCVAQVNQPGKRGLRELKINGHDVAALGWKGKEIGQRLAMAHEAMSHGAVENEKEALLGWIGEKPKLIPGEPW